MTRALLDTNVVSEIWKGERAARNVRRWFERQQECSFFVSVITLGELRYGIARLPEGQRRASLAARLESTIAEFSDRTLSVDSTVATHWGRMRAEMQRTGKTMPVIDSLLAASAFAYDCAFVTRNGRDVRYPGLTVLDPFAAERTRRV